MRRTFWCVFFGVALSVLPVNTSNSQALYIVVDYISADEVPAYLKLEEEWKTLHQGLVDQGMLEYWGLFQVAYPRGSTQGYNYATIRIYDDFSHVEDATQEGQYRVTHEQSSDVPWSRFVALTGEARELVKQEVFELVSTTGLEYETMGRYVEVDYMDTPEGREAAYVSAENEYWKPMQEQRISRGLMTGWDLWGLKYPAGTSEAYDFVTINFFDSYAKLALPDYPPEVIAGAHPDFKDGDFDRIVEETIATRSMVQMQLWIRLDQTEKSN